MSFSGWAETTGTTGVPLGQAARKCAYELVLLKVLLCFPYLVSASNLSLYLDASLIQMGARYISYVFSVLVLLLGL